jgi:hypothetical protein
VLAGYSTDEQAGVVMSLRSAWTLNRIIVLLLAGTLFGLTIDLRYEHVDKLQRFWEAWIPIVYSGVMAIGCVILLFRWGRGLRLVLFWGFTLSQVVGGLGFWLHNRGHFVASLRALAEAWTRAERHADRPPSLAPFLFCLLGILGMLACGTHFQPEVLSDTPEKQPPGSAA